VSEPYREGKIARDKESLRKVFASRISVEGQLVVVLNLALPSRRLRLITTPSRAVKKYEVHELIGTNEDAGPGQEVGNVWYLGFFEVSQGGVLLYGDEVVVGGRSIGEVAGFDETHMPNHINIVVKLREVGTGIDLKLRVGDKVIFKPSE
jgi:hypothetical protein